MFGLGATEIGLICLLIILFFGGKKLPGIGKALGQSIKGFKAGLKDEEDKKE